MEFKIKNKKEGIQFEEFVPKESNLIKVSLHDNGNDVEGIWACLNDKDFEDFKNNVRDSEPCRIATLRNSALMFYPNNSWGWCLPVQFCGNDRPECNVAWIDTEQDPVAIKHETVTA